MVSAKYAEVAIISNRRVHLPALFPTLTATSQQLTLLSAAAVSTTSSKPVVAAPIVVFPKLNMRSIYRNCRYDLTVMTGSVELRS